MKFVKVEKFICIKCNCKEYSVLDLNNISIVCSNCGEEYKGQYEVEEVEE